MATAVPQNPAPTVTMAFPVGVSSAIDVVGSAALTASWLLTCMHGSIGKFG
jgi:hypothetical protein